LLHLFLFLGGISLFLYGMQLMGNGLQQAAGSKLQRILGKLTKKTIYGVALGAGVTAILQSSSATTVMTVGLVNAGLMNLQQAFGIVMGANIGTTITAQLIAFKLTDYITLILAIGFLIQTVARKRNIRDLGQVLMGFGILMLGMAMMSDSVVPLRHNKAIVGFISRFSSQPILGLLVGLCMTVVIQSSSATVGILMAMASQGVIPLEGAVPVLLGDNIGTCITAVLATLQANIVAKRVALSHVMFNLIGSIIALIFMQQFLQVVLAVSPAHNIARQIANAHTTFNVVNTLLFLPFATKFTHFIERLVPKKGGEISYQPKFLNENMLGTPALALSLAKKEVIRMGSLALGNIRRSFACVNKYESKKAKYITEHEPVIDNLEEAITVYLTKLSEKKMSPELTAMHTGLLHCCSDIERIGDHAETIVKRVRSMNEEGMSFSPQAQKEMKELEDLVLETAEGALQALEDNDLILAQEALDNSHKVRKMEKAMRKSHVDRLNKGICTPETGFVMLELLINMKRVSDHAQNLCEVVLGEF
jgi:phosphate:Na+ symporter